MRILIIDNHLLSRDSLACFLSQQEDVEFVDTVATGRQGLQRYLEAEKPVDIVILEMKLPDMIGLELVQKIKKINPKQKIAFLTSVNSANFIVEAIKQGVVGYFSRLIEKDLLLIFLQDMMEGDLCISPDLATKLVPILKDLDCGNLDDFGFLSKQALLSSREMEVWEILQQGMNNKDIAKKLYISENTVKNHLRSIYNKLGVTNRTEAVALSFINVEDVCSE